MHPVEGTVGTCRWRRRGPSAWARVPWAAAGRGRSRLAGHHAPAAAAPRSGGGFFWRAGGGDFWNGGSPQGCAARPQEPTPARQPPPWPAGVWLPSPTAHCRQPLPPRPRPPGAGGGGPRARGSGSGRGGAHPLPSPSAGPSRVAAAAEAEEGGAGHAGGGGGRRRGGSRRGGPRAGRGSAGFRAAAAAGAARWCERAARLCRAGAHRLLRGRRRRAGALGGLLRWRRQDGRAPGAAGPRRPQHPRHGPGPTPGPRLAAQAPPSSWTWYARAGTRSPPPGDADATLPGPRWDLQDPLLLEEQGSPGRDAGPHPGGPERDPPAPPCANLDPQLFGPRAGLPAGPRLVPDRDDPFTSSPSRDLHILGAGTLEPLDPATATSVLAKPSSFSSPRFILHPAPSRDMSPRPPIDFLLPPHRPLPPVLTFLRLSPTHTPSHTHNPWVQGHFSCQALDLKPLNILNPFASGTTFLKARSPSTTAFLSPFSRTGASPHPL